MLKRIQGVAVASLALALSQVANGDAQDNETIFNWAEGEYSSYFYPSGQATASLDPWSFRFYPGSGIYLGINQADEVYVMGGAFGDTPSMVGNVNQFLEIINASAPSESDNATNNGSGNCVSVAMPASGLTQGYSFSDATSGYSGTVTIEYELVTDTRSRMTMNSSFAAGAYSFSSVMTQTSEYRIENNYVYESRTVSQTTRNMSTGSETTNETMTYSPEYLDGPVRQYCEGQSWSSASVQLTTTTSDHSYSSYTAAESGSVVSISEVVTVPAGTFDTVVLMTTDSSGNRSKIWISKQYGVFVKQEEYDAEDGSTVTLEVDTLN